VDLLESVGENFDVNFVLKEFPSDKQFIIWRINLERVLTEEKLDDTGARLEHTPRKLLKRLAQETGVSKSSARTATQLLKPSSVSWGLVCCKCKKDCCTCILMKQLMRNIYTCRLDSNFNTSCDL
jgi:hypothetical protein